MKNCFYILLFLMFYSIVNCYGQKRIILEHKTKSNRSKILKLERVYTIKTVDTTYYSNIVDLTDSTLSIVIWVKTDRDTTYFYEQYGKSKDTSITRPIYAKDTIAIMFSDVLFLKKGWFKSRRWLEPFGWIAIGAALGVGLLPFAVIEKGSEGVKEWAEFEAILFGVSLPVIFIGTRQTKYNIEKKWNIKTD